MKQNRKANLSKIKKNLFIEFEKSCANGWEDFMKQERLKAEQRVFEFESKYEILHRITAKS